MNNGPETKLYGLCTRLQLEKGRKMVDEHWWGKKNIASDKHIEIVTNTVNMYKYLVL